MSLPIKFPIPLTSVPIELGLNVSNDSLHSFGNIRLNRTIIGLKERIIRVWTLRHRGLNRTIIGSKDLSYLRFMGVSAHQQT
jgi:hypothetical protein